MSRNDLSANPAPQSRGYETRDVRVRAVLWLAVGIIVGALLVQGGLWLLGGHFESEATRGDPVPSPLEKVPSPIPPPHLQSAPSRDLAEFSKSQQDLLRTYGWIDKQQGIVRIPVSRAMELVLERGLQTSGEPSSPPK